MEKSILAKMLLGILLPIAIILVSASVLILNVVNKDLTNVTESELAARSQATSFQVSEFFTKYIELVRQTACNEFVLELLRQTTEPDTSEAAKAYPEASRSFDLTGDSLVSMMGEHKLGETGFYSLTTEENNIIFHPDAALIGKNVSELDLFDNIKLAVVESKPGTYTYSSAGNAK